MSLGCVDFERLWAAHAEGRLSVAQQERWELHLQQCAACARWLARLERLEHRLEDLGDASVEPPPYLHARVMAHLGEAGRGRRLAWALRRLFSSRRLLAVSMACLAFFAGLLVRELHRINDWMQQSPGSTVVIEYVAPEARDVRLVGDFNDWGSSPGAVRAERRDDRWVFRLRLDPGRYQYAFRVDGQKWLPDPGAPSKIPDGFGGVNSVLYVPDGERLRRESL